MVNQEIRQAKITKWTALLNDHASSGLRVADWCQENNISIHAYYYWKRIIKQEYVKSILPDIVPIGSASSEPISNPVSYPAAPALNSHNLCNPSPEDAQLKTESISVSVGDIHIEIGPTASDQLITSIIKAVRHA